MNFKIKTTGARVSTYYYVTDSERSMLCYATLQNMRWCTDGIGTAYK